MLNGGSAADDEAATGVDPMGLEPTTSSMPWRRSTGLSYGPRRSVHVTSADVAEAVEAGSRRPAGRYARPR